MAQDRAKGLSALRRQRCRLMFFMYGVRCVEVCTPGSGSLETRTSLLFPLGKETVTELGARARGEQSERWELG